MITILYKFQEKLMEAYLKFFMHENTDVLIV